MVQNQPLQLRRRHAGQPALVVTGPGGVDADVIAVLDLPLLAGVGRFHGHVAVAAAHQPLEGKRRLPPGQCRPVPPVLIDEAVDPIPKLLGDDGLVSAGERLPLVGRLPQVDPVLEDAVQRRLVDRLARTMHPGSRGPAFVLDAGGAQIPHHLGRRSALGEAAEDVAHLFGFIPIDHQFPAADVVSQRGVAAHPEALLAGCGILVADAVCRGLSFELGKTQKNVQRQPPHGGGGVERLGDAGEGDAVALEGLHQPGEIGQGAGKPVDLVDYHAFHLAGLDVSHEAFQRRAVGVAAGIGRIVVVVGNRNPPFRLLAGDVRQTGFPLRLQGVELLVQPLVGGFAGVDGAGNLGRGVDGGFAAHGLPPFRRPKNSGPDQWVPVMALATPDRLRYFRPWYSKPTSRIVTTCSTPFHSRINRAPGAGRAVSARRVLIGF
ncbi:hypothetical protein MAIT1_04601 [Magnetofaba australis IT-1]|uniref:Uncharacterized protein n=1 Tax=Magnetofaba australis IT-1 TaxID=1434232 RepID=A0A1Y2K9L1_9PROT|nr:hypothetical protein MAIT1_04601 [Magnetofaba australis IT-1]